MQLEGKRAVVTGGASGIGRATARALATHGARVVVADVDADAGEAAAAELAPLGAGAAFEAFDLADEASVVDFAGRVRAGGTPDILINAAGWDRLEPFVDNSLDFIDRVVRVNLLGPVKLTRELLPAMSEAAGRRIVNVASDAGRVGSSGETAYASAKGGVIAFTKSLARETARHGLCVNCVCPGPTDTPLFRSLPEKMQDALTRAIPFKRLAEPDEIAHAILFFASPAASFVTGQVLSVSGGLTMAG